MSRIYARTNDHISRAMVHTSEAQLRKRQLKGETEETCMLVPEASACEAEHNQPFKCQSRCWQSLKQ